MGNKTNPPELVVYKVSRNLQRARTEFIQHRGLNGDIWHEFGFHWKLRQQTIYSPTIHLARAWSTLPMKNQR